MCTFNTLVLPASADLDEVNVVATEVLHRAFMPQGNAAIEAAFSRDARSFVKSTDCDCGSGLGQAARPTDAGPSERELRKLRAEGWSEAKIRRWLEQRNTTQQKRELAYDARHGGVPASATAWMTFVSRILEERLAPWVGLFTHDYRGSVATEQIEVGAVRRFVGVTVEQIGEIEEDVPFVFSA